MNIPDTYYGQPVNIHGLFYNDKKKMRIVDHACGTWFYGHDDFFDGGCIPWMRLREEIDRSNNDVNVMVIVDGVWWHPSQLEGDHQYETDEIHNL